MLCKCPECELQVSDKARTCPHCGYPLKEEPKRSRKRSKRMRLPNGFGQITELTGRNLRRPFRAMITVGKNDDGRPIQKLLKPVAYFETYNDAYSALVEYNKNPYDLETIITLKDMYTKWLNEYKKNFDDPEKSTKLIQLAWTYSSAVHLMQVKNIKAVHLENCINNAFVIRNGVEVRASANIQYKMKSLFNMLFDYAVKYEYADKNVARAFSLSSSIKKEQQTTKKDHISFTDEEIKRLWEHTNHPYVDMILIGCYSGWRPQELFSIKLEDINLEAWTFKGGMKTENGKNRTVPIHTKIRSLLMVRYDHAKAIGSEYLFNCLEDNVHYGDKRFTHSKYENRFNAVVLDLGLNPEHRPHDTRKTFATLAKRNGIDEYALKYLIGHAITDLTEKVYVDRDLGWLIKEIEKIK